MWWSGASLLIISSLLHKYVLYCVIFACFSSSLLSWFILSITIIIEVIEKIRIAILVMKIIVDSIDKMVPNPDEFHSGCFCFRNHKSYDEADAATVNFKKQDTKINTSNLRTQMAGDLWWNKLREVFKTEGKEPPRSTNIQVVYHDTNTNMEYYKTLNVGPEETADDCIKLALERLEMRSFESSDFQLWAETARDESPYPLMGYERPFAIKLNYLRGILASEDGFDVDHFNDINDPVNRFHFILRSNVRCSPANCASRKTSNKKSIKTKKISQVFRRNKDQSSCLFGVPLYKLIDGESLPKPIMSILYQVFEKGPFIQGIFRKSANARQVRELREKLDAGVEIDCEIPVLVAAALLKDFLRSLPEPLLTNALYPQWKAAIESTNLNTKLYRLKSVILQLPKPNYLLLTYFLCVLYHIARRSSHTLMSAANLGVCVGPSLLWSNQPNVGDDLRLVPLVVECLITHCEYLCGSHVPSLLGDLRDSGTEESEDSVKHDDSSIDSQECGTPPRKDKISLSRDSGLTMSDSQLYSPDEEEYGSTNSSGYDPCRYDFCAKASMPSNYVRVYGGWEERLNPNHFERQAWFRQRSRRMNKLTNKNDVRRAASEESFLDHTSDPTPPPALPRRTKAHNYEETPIYPRKNPGMLGLRFDEMSCSSKSTDSPESECLPPFQSANNDLKDLNIKSTVSSAAESFISGKRSLPFNILTSGSNQSVSSLHRSFEDFNSIVCSLNSSMSSSHLKEDRAVTAFSSGDCYYVVRRKVKDAAKNCSTLPGNCSGSNKVTITSTLSPQKQVVRGRVKRKEEKASHRSRSLLSPPAYRPPPPATSRRAPITSYYLEDCNQIDRYVISRAYMEEESYV